MDVHTLRKLSNTPTDANRAIMRLAAADAAQLTKKFRDVRRKSSLLIHWAQTKDNRMKIERVSYSLDALEEDLSEKNEAAEKSSFELSEQCRESVEHFLDHFIT